MICARSSCASIIRSYQRLKIVARFPIGVSRQPGSASLAASMARRVSLVPHFAMLAIVSPVAGFVTSKVSPLSASVHCPSMYA
jgi:hypothetical protein